VVPSSGSGSGSAPGMMSDPVEWRRSSSWMWPGVPFTLAVTSANACSNASRFSSLIFAKTITRAGIRLLASFDVEQQVLNCHPS
jgi:hypothetical protein